MANQLWFTFIANTINGQIQEVPVAVNIRCAEAKPLGCDIIKQYNKTQCIVAIKVFLVYYKGDVFGSTQFTGVAQFTQYMNQSCRVFCTPANLTIKNCSLQLSGCDTMLWVSCPERIPTIWGCSLTVNGCNLSLN